MKNSRLFGAACACISVFTTPQALSEIIDTYFGWNYVGSFVYSPPPPGIPISPIPLPELSLNEIMYIGESGTITQAINFGGISSMPDGEGLGMVGDPTYTMDMVLGDGESTRTTATSMPIDWIPAGTITPWGVTYAFPTIGITGITAFGVPGELLGSGEYVIGLIPLGVNTELDSALGGLQSHIYDAGRIVRFSPGLATGLLGYGDFIFSGAQVVPVPAAVWLFGSGLIGLIGTARRKKS